LPPPLLVWMPAVWSNLETPSVEHRISLGELVALALAGDHVQELRPLEALEVVQRGDQRVEVVAVDRAVVVEAELLEQRARADHALGVLLDLARELGHRRRHAEHLLADTARSVVGRSGQHAGEDLGERPDRRRDRHLVVVEDHQQVDVLHVAGVVERLEGHACRHRAIADHRDRVTVLAARARRHRHAEGGRDRGRGVRRAEGVVIALAAPRKAGDAAEVAQPRHRLAAAGEDLVAVGLVADVPHDAVVRGIEDVMEGDGQLDRAEIGRKMAAGPGYGLDQEGAQFAGECVEITAVERAHIGG